jgi:putative transcriptional regulator
MACHPGRIIAAITPRSNELDVKGRGAAQKTVALPLQGDNLAVRDGVTGSGMCAFRWHPAGGMGMARGGAVRASQAGSYLDGQMLVAMPSMRDERFSKSVIYMCAHSADGAMGIVVNHPAAHIDFKDLLVQLEIVPAADLIMLPRQAEAIKVLKGGPVETGRGFVLHSADYFVENSTLPIDEGICLTATLDILKAIARGDGPSSAVLALGYAGWAAGQLESEIQSNGWLHCPADPDLIFGMDNNAKYERAMKKIGIDARMLSSEAGHA